MTDIEQTPATEEATTSGEAEQGEQQEQTFTQADIDRIVRDRVKREREKFADYDDLKAKAGEVKTAEERIAELEARHAKAERSALVASVAAEHGISAEDRDLFLTGADVEALTAQAERVAALSSERKKRSNHVPNEGTNPRPAEDERRKLATDLFG